MIKRIIHFFVFTSLLLGLFITTPATPARAASIVVTTHADVIANDGFCSLREALIAAHTNTASGAAVGECSAGGGADVITFSSNFTIWLSGTELPTIKSFITINGDGNVQIKAAVTPDSSTSRIFLIGGDGNLTLNGLTLSNGRCRGACATYSNYGGAILNQGTLIINNSFLTANAADYGGAIYNMNGSLLIENTKFMGNYADHGGGIFSQTSLNVTNSVFENNNSEEGGGVFNSGFANISSSTFSENTASIYGGAIFNETSLSVANSTFHQNSAGLGGGGIVNQVGFFSAINSTFSKNSANYGGGIYNGNNTYHSILLNVILWDNTIKQGNPSVNNYNATSDIRNSILQGGCPDGSTCTSVFDADPVLGPLADNGGKTPTMALGLGSAAADNGTNVNCPDKDQRNISRPRGNRCDIGAFESNFLVATSIGAQDGWVLESSETSGKGGKVNKSASTLNVGDDSANRQYRTILSFDASALPGNAVIASITLRVKRQGVTGGSNPVNTFKGFMVDIKTGSFGKAGLQLGDFKTKADKTLGVFKPAPVNGWYQIDLTPASTYINRNGVTQIRLRFKLDDNNNAKANFLKLYSGNAAVENRPQLFIEYVPIIINFP